MRVKYSFEELDKETQDYLLAARDRKGIGMPGIMVPTIDVKPWFSLIAGLIVIGLTIYLTFPPKKGPIPMALGQTAGFLLGGWLVVAAFRMWIAYRGSKAAGHFVYVDPEFLYLCRGSMVEVIDLINLRTVSVNHKYTNNKYNSSALNLRIDRDSIEVNLPNEELANKVKHFLDAVILIRDSGENPHADGMKNLSAPLMAAMSLHYAQFREFPERITQENLEITYIPKPQAVNRPSLGCLGLIGTIVAGILLFVFFYNTNPVIKQETEWDELKDQPLEFQVPMLRAYLADERNQSHRQEAKDRLTQFYNQVANDRVRGIDPNFAQAMKRLVTDLAQRQAVISIAVRDQSPSPDEQKRKHLADFLADRLGATIGDTLVNFVLLDKEADFKAQIELEYVVVNPNLIEYNLEIRPDRTADPILKVTKVPFSFKENNVPNFGINLPVGNNMPYPQDGVGLFIIPTSVQTKLAEDLVSKLVGPVRPRPVPRDDF